MPMYIKGLNDGHVIVSIYVVFVKKKFFFLGKNCQKVEYIQWNERKGSVETT